MATLKDVIDRLKAEGQLVRNTGTNSIKSVKEEMSVISSNITMQNVILKDTFLLLKNWYDEEKTRAALGSVSGEPTITPTTKPPAVSTPTTETSSGFDFSVFASIIPSLQSLGLLLGPLALGLGTTIGVIQGQLKAIQLFFPKTTNFIIEQVTKFGDFVKNSFASIRSVLSGFTSYISGFFSFGPTSTVGKVFETLKTGVNYLLKPLTEAANTISAIVGSSDNAASIFSRIASGVSFFAETVSKISSAVSRVFLPITIVMTAYDTITAAIDGFNEEGVLGALEGAVTGFFNSLIFAPLDLLKSAVAWIVGKLGFDETSELLNSFSFTDLWSGLVGTVFNGVSAMFSSISDSFSFTAEDATLLGGIGKLTDIAFAGVNSAINFVSGIFGFTTEGEEPFRLQDWITNKVNEIIAYISDIFSFLPSIEEMKTILLSYLPDWMQPESIEEQKAALQSEIEEQRNLIAEGDDYNWRGKSREDIIEDIQEELDALNGVRAQTAPTEEFQENFSFRTGTKGFQYFGAGSQATLHGVEAVVPRGTPAGQFLDSNFDENWNPIMSRIQSAAMQNTGAPIIISNSPTIAPVNASVRGGTNYNNTRATVMGDIGGGSGLGRFAN